MKGYKYLQKDEFLNLRVCLAIMMIIDLFISFNRTTFLDVIFNYFTDNDNNRDSLFVGIGKTRSV
jgi:hypothetical protein